jgi:predicted RNA-binding Zn-ribbon protein involved in translation (DUF1610 family)
MSDKTNAPYPAAWAEIQQGRRRAAIGTWVFAIGLFFWGVLTPSRSPMRYLVLVPVAIGATILVAYLAKFRCPCCGERVMTRGRFAREARLAAGKCSHCGKQIGPVRQ